MFIIFSFSQYHAFISLFEVFNCTQLVRRDCQRSHASDSVAISSPYSGVFILQVFTFEKWKIYKEGKRYEERRFRNDDKKLKQKKLWQVPYSPFSFSFFFFFFCFFSWSLFQVRNVSILNHFLLSQNLSSKHNLIGKQSWHMLANSVYVRFIIMRTFFHVSAD